MGKAKNKNDVVDVSVAAILGIKHISKIIIVIVLVLIIGSLISAITEMRKSTSRAVGGAIIISQGSSDRQLVSLDQKIQAMSTPTPIPFTDNGLLQLAPPLQEVKDSKYPTLVPNSLK